MIRSITIIPGLNPKLNINMSDQHIIIKKSNDYNALENKPKINNVELIGNLSSEDIDIKTMSESEINRILDN